jgi:AcrR family transcriptional regulator
LSVGAIYFYFKDKEELFAALQLEGLDLLRQAIGKALKKGISPEEKIRAIAAAYLQFSDKHKNYYDIINYFLTSPGTVFSPDLKNEIDSHGNASIFMLTEAFSEGIEKGLFKPVDPRRQAIILWSTFNGVIQLKKLENTILARDDYHSLYTEALERFLDGLRA